jgi:hypothetical protein
MPQKRVAARHTVVRACGSQPRNRALAYIVAARQFGKPGTFRPSSSVNYGDGGELRELQ